MTYKLFVKQFSTGKWACISPAVLKFTSKEDGEIVADRYRRVDKTQGNGRSEYAVLPVDERGYIVPEHGANRVRKTGAEYVVEEYRHGWMIIESLPSRWMAEQAAKEYGCQIID